MSTSFLLIFPHQEGKLIFIEYLLCARTFSHPYQSPEMFDDGPPSSPTHCKVDVRRAPGVAFTWGRPMGTPCAQALSSSILHPFLLPSSAWFAEMLLVFQGPSETPQYICWQHPHDQCFGALVLWSACLCELIWTCTMTICWVHVCLPQSSSGSLHVP